MGGHVQAPVGRPDPKKRPDYKEENYLAQGIGGVAHIAEAHCNIAAGDAGQIIADFGIAPEVPVVQQTDSVLAADQDRALVVEERLQRLDRPAAVVEQEIALVVHDEGRVGEGDEDSLRPVLEVPAAPGIRGVVAGDELAQCNVTYAFTLDKPVTPSVEVQPAVHRRNVRPLGEAADDDFVHRTTIFRQEEKEVYRCPQSRRIWPGPGSPITRRACRRRSRFRPSRSPRPSTRRPSAPPTARRSCSTAARSAFGSCATPPTALPLPWPRWE